MGTLTLERRDERWFLAESPPETEISCLLSDDFGLDESAEEQRVDVVVSAYMRGTDGSVDHLHLDPTPTLSSATEGRDGSLDRIAKRTFGDRELPVTDESDDSAVGKARKRARKQGRDPAIDSRFRP
jgi:hypothetical protein